MNSLMNIDKNQRKVNSYMNTDNKYVLKGKNKLKMNSHMNTEKKHVLKEVLVN